MSTEFVAFADEAGALHVNETLHRFCFVSGFMAERRVWEDFATEWRRTLQDGVPFSSKQFFSRDPRGRRERPYVGWEDTDDDRYLHSLIGLILKRPISKLGSAVDVEAFRQYTLGERKWLTGARFQGGQFQTPGSPDRPYFVAFHRVIWTAMQRTPPASKVHFVFCRSADRVRWSEDFYTDLRELVDASPFENRLGDLTFAYAKDEPALQAADLRAHLWNQIFQRSTLVSQSRKNAAVTLEGDSRIHGVYDAAYLEQALADLPPEIRAALRAYRGG